MANQSKLKAWVRYDGTGRVVTAGPIFQANKPKVGNWRQINSSLCCNGSSTTTTTTQGGGGSTPTAFVVRIAGGIEEACGDIYGIVTILYSASSTLGVNSTLYTDAALTQPLSGLQYVRVTSGTTVYTSSLGTITQETVCSTTTTTTTLPPGVHPVRISNATYGYTPNCSNPLGEYTTVYTNTSNPYPTLIGHFWTDPQLTNNFVGNGEYYVIYSIDVSIPGTAQVDQYGNVYSKFNCN